MMYEIWYMDKRYVKPEIHSCKHFSYTWTNVWMFVYLHYNNKHLGVAHRCVFLYLQALEEAFRCVSKEILQVIMLIHMFG